MASWATLPETAEDIWAELMAGNERFRTGLPQPRDLVREREAVAEAQHPRAIVLTCGDSRVSPEIVFDQKLGELFVVRAAGCTAEAAAVGSMEYAAEYFGCSLLVVLGHQYCGAVRAACDGTQVTSPNMKAVLKWIRQAYFEIAPKLGGETDLAEVEKYTVAISMQAILDRSPDLHRLTREGRLAIIPAYYHLDSGVVSRLA
ncbi:MAG: carbonic anhydrase [Terriglobales bacterium]